MSGLTTSESGGTATFSLVLDSKPHNAFVLISISSSDESEGVVSAASVVFSVSNWNVLQTLTITGVADHRVDGSIAYTVETGTFVSADANFHHGEVVDVTVTNTDRKQCFMWLYP
jgi:hypothetical protein